MAKYQRLCWIFKNTKQKVGRQIMLAGLRVTLTITTVVAAVAILGFQVVVGASPSSNAALVAQGKQIFRFDTFGDETMWIGKLKLHEVVRTAVDPTTALSVGLKVDAEALPAAVVAGIKNGSISLKNPDTTVALLKLNAVIGLKGKVETMNCKDVLTHFFRCYCRRLGLKPTPIESYTRPNVR